VVVDVPSVDDFGEDTRAKLVWVFGADIENANAYLDALSVGMPVITRAEAERMEDERDPQNP
jgi:hypothetical protein